MIEERSLRAAAEHGLFTGVICGMWVLLPSLFILMNSEDDSLIALAADFLLIIVVYPALVCMACLVATSSSTNWKEITLISLVCSISSMLIMNLIIQMYILIYQGMNDITIGIEISTIFNLDLILNALFFGILASGIRICNKSLGITSENKEEEIKINYPPKPTHDPRIEQLHFEIKQSNLAIIELRNEILQINK